MSFPRYPEYKDSGVEWLGEVPGHWATPPLYLRYSVELGKMLDSSRITGDHLVPYLRNVDVQWGRINFDDLPEMDIEESEYGRYTVAPGDLLVCEGGEVGRAAIVPETKEQVESLGAKFVEVPMTDEEKKANDGVYAKEMSDDYKRRQGELMAKHAKAADIVITTALIPGKKAPILLEADIVAGMKPGAVIVDIAAESGGNCPLTRPGAALTTDGGVTVVGFTNLPGMVAADASKAPNL